MAVKRVNKLTIRINTIPQSLLDLLASNMTPDEEVVDENLDVYDQSEYETDEESDDRT